LRSLMIHAGFTSVQTYIQSGNIIFCSEKNDPAPIAEFITHVIAEKYSFEVPVIIRTVTELKKIIDQNPFLQRVEIMHKALYLTLLSEEPSAQVDNDLLSSGLTSEVYAIREKQIYLHIPEGYGKTKWTNTFFEKKLKMVATTRNWASIMQLIKISENSICPETKS